MKLDLQPIVACAALAVAAPALAQDCPDPTLPDQPTNVEVVHYYGQTFITWEENATVSGERYRIYRSDEPIDRDAIETGRALPLKIGDDDVEVWEDSGEFYADRIAVGRPCEASDPAKFEPRFLRRLHVPSASSVTLPPASTSTVDEVPGTATGGPPRRGGLVWTIDFSEDEDYGAHSWYAVTTVLEAENLCDFSSENVVETDVDETEQDPMPLDVTEEAATHEPEEIDPLVARVYLQYMDLRDWNPTFHAPNPTNCWWGEDPSIEAVSNAWQYAYCYMVIRPDPATITCGGALPLVLDMHIKARNDIEVFRLNNPAPACDGDEACAIKISPVDVSDTWWFGFSAGFDYRTPGAACPGSTVDCSGVAAGAHPNLVPGAGEVVNYTELRLLRMIHDLSRDQAYFHDIDMDRVYAIGHSMGGSGALALAMRYPQVFAAAACSKPMTDYRSFAFATQTDCGGAPDGYAEELQVRWGDETPNRTVRNIAPAGWADQLPDGDDVFDWQNHPLQAQLRRDDPFVPFGMSAGALDDTIPFDTQGITSTTELPVFEGTFLTWGALVSCVGHGANQRFQGLPAGLHDASVPADPFFCYSVVRAETVPGLDGRAPEYCDPPKMCTCTSGTVRHYLEIEWSASWNAWDQANGNAGTPIEDGDDWVMSLRLSPTPPTVCPTLSGAPTADVTPRSRRFQGDPLRFAAEGPADFDVLVLDIALDQKIVDTTISVADGDRLILEDVPVSSGGTRITVHRQ